ncbi:MAG: hypothetical protein KJ915_05875 [Candidatus Omnitrophica bacterium]|nr:hypothetical protein [Candidatus Omnitrophota bacterium]
MKTKVLITIDTEFSSHKDGMGIFGNIAGKFYGIPLFMQLARKYNIKFTFFVDVYGVREIFKKEFIKICNELIVEGHELQLHTHPDGLFDKNRGKLCLYSLAEQIQIIKKGKELFESWFRISPLAHRAGDWGANNDTLIALLKNGIRLDSSMFAGYKYCELSRNSSLVQSKGIIELPPSTYKINGLKIFNNGKLLSTNGNPLSEILYVLENKIKERVPIINFVYHSFSFLKWNKKRTKYEFSKNEIAKFEVLLNIISKNSNLEPTLLRTLNVEKYLNANDKEISTGLVYFIPRLLDRMKH